jgi:serine/threonine-protein kinase
MTDDARVEGLLEQLLDSGGTPEEVCRDCPELLTPVRAGWERLRALQGEMDAMFPETKPAEFVAAATPPTQPPAAELPQVRGYEIQGELGRGGMGVVYKALHLRLNRPVALKMLLAGPFARPEELERFLREAEAVARLRHPNIVQVHDVGDAGGRPYFTMELVEGGSLSEKLKGTPYPARQAAVLVATLAGAIQAAHQCGFVHRDLKPGNVLLTAEGAPRITDFGLARRLDGGEGLTLSGIPMGTPSYMAPEQARGDRNAVGPASDVYALGAILYELLTGRPPFRGETATATLRQVMADEPVPPGRLNPAVPRDLQTICLKCLQKEPHRRYASAHALADDLRRFERHEPITARPTGTLERAAKWARRRPAAATLLAAALLMLAGITAAAVWYAGDRAQRRAEIQSRGREVNREANAALEQAESHLQRLRDRLDDPIKVRELLSDIDQWQRLVEQAQEDWQRVKTACVGNEALLTEQTRARIQAVEATVAREEAAYELARELDNIAVEELASGNSKMSPARKAAAEYEALFARQGLDLRQSGTAGVASAIRSSPVRFALLAALDNWASLAYTIKDLPRLGSVLELARAADPDPWRDRFRDPVVWADSEALTRLAREVDVGRQPPKVLALLGRLMYANGVDPTALFERALLHHPRDFWLHLYAAMYTNEPGVKIGLALAALAVRPRNARAYSILANALRQRGDWPEALEAADRAIEINPTYFPSYIHRGFTLLRVKKDLPGAVAAFRSAAEADPNHPWPFWSLRYVFLLQGDRSAAADAYRKAADRELPTGAFWKHGGWPAGLHVHLWDLNGQPEAADVYRKVTELDPDDFLSRTILGQVLQQQGRFAEAEQAYLGAITAEPACVLACNALARLLATCPDDKVRDGKRAVEYATTACERTGWHDPVCLDTLASAYAEAGQFEEAVRYQTRALDDRALRNDLRPGARQRLELYRQKKPFRDQGL